MTDMSDPWVDWGADEYVSDGLTAVAAALLAASIVALACMLGTLLGLVVLAL